MRVYFERVDLERLNPPFKISILLLACLIAVNVHFVW